MVCNDYCGKIVHEFRSPGFYRDIVAEGIATFFLVSVQCALPLTWDRTVAPANDAAYATLIGVGMGFVILVLAETFGELGGANMNPAVSIALCLGNKLTVTKGNQIRYV